MLCPKQMAAVHQFPAGGRSRLVWLQQSCYAAPLSHLPCVPTGHPPCPAQPPSTPEGESWGPALHPSLVLPCLWGVHSPPGPSTSPQGDTSTFTPRSCCSGPSSRRATWCPGTCCLGRSLLHSPTQGTIPGKERRRHREPREPEELLTCPEAGRRQVPPLWGAVGSRCESPETQPA